MPPNILTTDSFIARWQASGAAERANYQLFLSELCDVLDLPRPNPTVPDEAGNVYVFEKPVPLPHGTTGRIDLYRRGSFVLEAKQGSDQQQPPAALSTAGERQRKQRRRGTAVRGTSAWDTAMERAKQQAQMYARNLPPGEIGDGRPPFLVVVDVGQSIALYAEFTRSGGNYLPFPDPQSYRIELADLTDEDTRELLRTVWLDPMSLDPARRSARVTRDIADRLARLARALEGDYDPETVAHFLMRCLFTMFAEDVGLLPAGSFTQLLADARRNVAHFPEFVGELWRTMNTGGFSLALRLQIPYFDGGLFEESSALPLTADQLQLLIEAAQADWRDVEPAIFGTLLERALDPTERHKLGAHYTPRAYVDRLVLPTVVEPLRAEWEAAQAAALLLAEQDKAGKALDEIEQFQQRLASVRVLDPACGSGNFLYATLEHLKRLEGEVLEVRRQLGGQQMLLEMESLMVRPEQFLGIEVNPRAAAIAELVLWIGFLQWHFRSHGDVRPPEPIIHRAHNIECRDAVLAWDAVEPLLDGDGNPVTRWDGRTTKTHPVTGLEVPDETARVPAFRYINPRPAEWPQTDFVVGNPPFIGTARMRDALGDGYTEAIRKAYKNVPASADYVMFWWDKAAELARSGRIQRFGLITTNSLRQTFNRRVIEHHLSATPPLSLLFAIPDHPWVDTTDGAAVRIAMTVGAAGEVAGVLQEVATERAGDGDAAEISFRRSVGRVLANLTTGSDVAGATALKANGDVSGRGVQLFGSGFIVTEEEAQTLGLGTVSGLERHIRPYRNGRDLTATPRGVMVIDLFGLSVDEVRTQFPAVYQWVYERVKPDRDQNNRASYRINWWIHGEPRASLRPALSGLSRYIATVETSKHRFFVFLDASILPDNMLVNIALDEAWFLGVLSSRVHVTWALGAGGRLGVGNDPRYNKTRCFEPFPFPAASDEQKARIRAIAEELDAHRKRQQALHPKLTLTDMYNVQEKLCAGQPLTGKDKAVHEQGLVSVLRQLHDDLDAAVFDAYGWPVTLSDEQILERLVALNAERAAEEERGIIRWLRPEYQAPDDHASRFTQHALIEEDLPADQPDKESRSRL
ncbi:MAG: class I SAM-dependent DNA methyltransferase, partial [Anaerolineae bacterium]|nr:class I SAM-dependent DNA methyltransferase [Anaerolineae bacterium]